MSSSDSVFEGPRLTFERKDVFGKKYAKRKATNDCIVTNILEAIHFTGEVKADWIDKLDKQDLWLYIHYLWFHNHETNMTFQEMRDGAKASAVLFVKTIVSVLHDKVGFIKTQDEADALLQNPQMIDNACLAAFINYVVEDARKTEMPVNIPAISNIVNVTFEKLRDQEAIHDRAFEEVQSSLMMIKNAVNKAQNVQKRVRFVRGNANAANANTGVNVSAKLNANAMRKNATVGAPEEDKSDIVVKLITSRSK